MRRLPSALMLVCALAACSPSSAPTPARTLDMAAAVSRATVGGAVLQAQSVPLSALNPATARQYGIDNTQDGVLLLITLRDANGDALAPADLQLTATASVLPDPPAALPLRAIQTGGMTDYIGVLQVRAPASVSFKLNARRGGDRNAMAMTMDLLPR